MPDDLRQARALNRVEFERLLNLYLTKTKSELDEIAGVPPDDDEEPSLGLRRHKDVATFASKVPALDLVVVQLIRFAIVEGDERRLGFLLDRLIGKVKDPESDRPTFNFINLPRHEVLAIGEQAMQLIKAAEGQKTIDAETGDDV